MQGFIALLLNIFQSRVQKTCISPSLAGHMLPCQRAAEEHTIGRYSGRMLSGDATAADFCRLKGKVLMLSSEVIHQLEIFIFVMAVTHVTFSVSTMLLGFAKLISPSPLTYMRQWKQWDAELAHIAENAPSMGTGQDSRMLSSLHSFIKQFYGSVSKIDYAAMRLCFLTTKGGLNQRFNFHKYITRNLQNDLKKVVGISWYMWIFVVFYLLLNINGWHTYFWIAFLPLLLLLAVGTKLQHIIAQLAQDEADKHSAIEGDLIVKPLDDHFWFGRPRVILYLIHFILFQNAFQIAFFIWILITYGFNSCIMGQAGFTVPRLVIGVIIQCLCSYSTLPLYAIVIQMASCYKPKMFDDNVEEGLQRWAQRAQTRMSHLSTLKAN